MHVVPIKGKKEEDLAAGMIVSLHNMDKKPNLYIPRMKVLYLKNLFRLI